MNNKGRKNSKMYRQYSQRPSLGKIIEVDNESSPQESSPLTPMTSIVRDLGRYKISNCGPQHDDNHTTPISSRYLQRDESEYNFGFSSSY